MTERTNEYDVVEVSADLPDSNTIFDTQVKEKIAEGWQCLGPSLIDNRNFWVQKVYRPLTDNETEQ